MYIDGSFMFQGFEASWDPSVCHVFVAVQFLDVCSLYSLSSSF